MKKLRLRWSGMRAPTVRGAGCDARCDSVAGRRRAEWRADRADAHRDEDRDRGGPGGDDVYRRGELSDAAVHRWNGEHDHHDDPRAGGDRSDRDHRLQRPGAVISGMDPVPIASLPTTCTATETVTGGAASVTSSCAVGSGGPTEVSCETDSSVFYGPDASGGAATVTVTNAFPAAAVVTPLFTG